MATGTAGSSARNLSQQIVHFLRKSITYADNGTTVTVGTIPAGSTIIKPASGVSVSTVFDGDTTNTLDVGASTDSGTNNFATALTLGGLGFVPLDEAVSGLVTVDTIIQCYVVSTASASTGAAEVIICYVPDTDG